jgi:hypothetical protein
MQRYRSSRVDSSSTLPSRLPNRATTPPSIGSAFAPPIILTRRPYQPRLSNRTVAAAPSSRGDSRYATERGHRSTTAYHRAAYNRFATVLSAAIHRKDSKFISDVNVHNTDMTAEAKDVDAIDANRTTPTEPQNLQELLNPYSRAPTVSPYGSLIIKIVLMHSNGLMRSSPTMIANCRD